MELTNILNVGTGSARFNSNKVRMSYIPAQTQADFLNYCEIKNLVVPVRGLVRLAEHFSLGSAKYPDEKTERGHGFPNWAKGQLFEKMLIDSMLRHYYAWLAGESIDPDFGSHHLIAIAWGWSCLYHQFSNYDIYKQYDDRMWIGFNQPKISPVEISHELFSIQTCGYTDICMEICLEGLYDTLVNYQLTTDDLNESISFKIDSERLEKIKATNYGTPVKA